MRALFLLAAILSCPSLFAQSVDVTGEMDINQASGSLSALDVRGNGTGKGFRIFIPSSVDPGTYTNDGGGFYSRVWMVLSGSYTGTGEHFQITHPTASDPFMLALWGDIAGPNILSRTANVAGAYQYSGLDRNANYTFSIEEDGALQWGATSTRAGMDAGLSRDAPGALKVTDAAGGFGDLSIGRGHMEPQATAAATCSPGDYYFDDSSALCLCMTTDIWSRVFGNGTCV